MTCLTSRHKTQAFLGDHIFDFTVSNASSELCWLTHVFNYVSKRVGALQVLS